jgi:hypothetical protein
VTLASGPVLGSAATGGSGLPADQTAHAASPELAAAALSLPRGSVWAAQVGAVRSGDFVLLVAGMPFEIAGAPPAGKGGSLMVRVVDDTGLPVFDVLANEAPHAQNIALRSLLAHLLHRALAGDAASPPSAAVLEAASPSSRDIAAALQHGAHDRLTRPTPDLTHYLETGVLRLDVQVAPSEPPPGWRVEIHDTHQDGQEQEDAVTAMVFVDLPDTGPVEARLALSAGRLRVHFVVGSDEVREHLLGQAGELTAALVSAGFSGVELAAQADPGRLARDRATNEVPRDTPRAGGLLDIRA